MKALLLFILFSGFLTFSSFAQINDSFRTTPEMKKFFKKERKNDWLNIEKSDNPLLFPFDSQENSFKSSGDALPELNNTPTAVDYPMPILQPTSHHPMRVHEPDTTVSYSIRVKKF